MGKQSARQKAKRTDPKTTSLDEMRSGRSRQQKYSADELLDKVEEYVEECNFELAYQFCERALKQEPENPRALEFMGEILLEAGNADAAHQCLVKAIEVEPEGSFTKYLYLAQLQPGAVAVATYRKGMELMDAERRRLLEFTPPKEEEARELAARMSTVFCAIAELFMSDLCYEDNAEAACEEAVSRALQCDPSSAEALQTKASLLISQQRPEEARPYIRQSVEMWMGKDEDQLEGRLPSYDTRVASARILIELGEHELAGDVLDRLLDEDDNVVQVWYLSGWNAYVAGDLPTAKSMLKKTLELRDVLAQEPGFECDDEQLLQHANELLVELANVEEVAEDDGANDEGAWTDEDDEGEAMEQ